MLENKIEELKLNEEIIEKLKENKIMTTKQLAKKTKTELKEIGLRGYQISEVEIKLQLKGLDLRGSYIRRRKET